MRVLWTLFKIIVGLAIAIPLGIVALGLAFGILGTVLALAILALKVACIAFVGYGFFRVARYVFGSSAKQAPPVVRELSEPRPDAYYEAAMRELDSELGRTAR